MSRMNTARHHGFTLVELFVAIPSAIMLILFTSIVLVSAHRSMDKLYAEATNEVKHSSESSLQVFELYASKSLDARVVGGGSMVKLRYWDFSPDASSSVLPSDEPDREITFQFAGGILRRRIMALDEDGQNPTAITGEGWVTVASNVTSCVFKDDTQTGVPTNCVRMEIQLASDGQQIEATRTVLMRNTPSGG